MENIGTMLPIIKFTNNFIFKGKYPMPQKPLSVSVLALWNWKS